MQVKGGGLHLFCAMPALRAGRVSLRTGSFGSSNYSRGGLQNISVTSYFVQLGTSLLGASLALDPTCVAEIHMLQLPAPLAVLKSEG